MKCVKYDIFCVNICEILEWADSRDPTIIISTKCPAGGVGAYTAATPCNTILLYFHNNLIKYSEDHFTQLTSSLGLIKCRADNSI